MKFKFLTAILVCSVFLNACQKQEDVNKSDAVAVVNGQYISKASLDTLRQEISQRMRGQAFPDEQLIEKLVQREILLQDAVKKKLDQTPEMVARLEMLKQSLLSQAALQDFIKNNEITDAELKAEYEKQTGTGDNFEFKARHILVKTEAEAKEVIVKLDKGGDFTELAKELSTGPSGPKGGDLGWFAPKQMVAPFSEAVIAMENGQYSSEPVQTDFGFHVILREDSRAQAVPEFETVKAKMLPMLQRKKVKDYVAELRKQAKVEVLLVKVETEASPIVHPVTASPIVHPATTTPMAGVDDGHGHSHAKSAEEMDMLEKSAPETGEMVKATEETATETAAEAAEMAKEVKASVTETSDKAAEMIKAAE